MREGGRKGDREGGREREVRVVREDRECFHVQDVRKQLQN